MLTVGCVANPGAGECEIGAETACFCALGEAGVRRCGFSGQLGPCECVDVLEPTVIVMGVPDSGGPDNGPTPNSGTSDHGLDPRKPAAGVMIVNPDCPPATTSEALGCCTCAPHAACSGGVDNVWAAMAPLMNGELQNQIDEGRLAVMLGLPTGGLGRGNGVMVLGVPGSALSCQVVLLGAGVDVVLPLGMGGQPIKVPISNARLELEPSSDGFTRGVLGGAVVATS